MYFFLLKSQVNKKSQYMVVRFQGNNSCVKQFQFMNMLTVLQKLSFWKGSCSMLSTFLDDDALLENNSSK